MSNFELTNLNTERYNNNDRKKTFIFWFNQFSYKYIMNSFVVNYGDKMAQIFNFNNSNIK